MDNGRLDRLETSFQLLAPRGPELVDRFYAHLFSENPGVRPMFPKDMSGQKKKLLASLVLIIQNIRKTEALIEPLKEMVRRHVEYGTQPAHYPIVRDSLIGVMQDMAGSAWNQQLTEDWTAALNLVAGVMLEGAKEAASAKAN